MLQGRGAIGTNYSSLTRLVSDTIIKLQRGKTKQQNANGPHSDAHGTTTTRDAKQTPSPFPSAAVLVSLVLLEEHRAPCQDAPREQVHACIM